MCENNKGVQKSCQTKPHLDDKKKASNLNLYQITRQLNVQERQGDSAYLSETTFHAEEVEGY